MLQGLQPPVKEALCPFMKRVAELDPKDAQAVLGYLEDPRWTHATLAAALSQNGLQVSETPLWRHRTKKCACAKRA